MKKGQKLNFDKLADGGGVGMRRKGDKRKKKERENFIPWWVFFVLIIRPIPLVHLGSAWKLCPD